MRRPWLEFMWRLQTLRRKLPGDTAVAVAILQGMATQGKAAEAIAIASELWHRRQSMSDQVAITYGALLAHLGMYDQAFDFATKNLHGHGRIDPVDLFTAVHAAWGMGDEAALGEVLEHEEEGLRGLWLATLAKMRAAGILPSMRHRQDIVRRHLYKKQCGTHLVFTINEDSEAELTHYVFVAADHQERSKISDSIYAEMQSFYGGIGLGGVDFWTCAPLIILDQRHRSSIQEETKRLVPEAA